MGPSAGLKDFQKKKEKIINLVWEYPTRSLDTTIETTQYINITIFQFDILMLCN